VSAVRNRWLVAALVLALVAGVLVWATVGADRQRPAGTADQAAGIRDGGTVRFAASGEPTGFNPNTSANNSPAVQDVVGNVYPSVFRGQPDFSVRLDGELMAGAELTSDRPQTVTYRIRGDAVWSDGTPISDDDFTYLWRRSNGSDRRIDVASTTGYQDIESVTGSPDGKTVTARFARPFADWRTLFANLLPAQYVERQRGGWKTGLDKRPEQIPSGGPFRITRHERGQSLTLAHPILRDIAVREAIALATDRQQLLDRTVGQISDRARVLGNRIWLVGQPGYEDHSGGYGRGDLAAAAARLDQAGWTEGAGGVRVKNGRKLLLRYSTTQGVRGREQAGELLQDQLAKVGIDLELRPVDGGTLFGDRLPDGGFEIAAFAWIGGPNAVSGSRDTYVTGGTLNFGKFSDPAVDALFEQATAELDPDRSIALANQIDRRLWEGLHSIPLYQRPTFLAWRGTLRNLADNPTTEGPLWNAESWGFAAGTAAPAP
jgi:ABC-type transport system substrate-binding protein